ncbi:MAG: ATP-binding cassette domain-containing protein [Cellulomonas sp.]|nr:ATP-binding cassette domain-containing protein [Cellulomonas sp.]
MTRQNAGQGRAPQAPDPRADLVLQVRDLHYAYPPLHEGDEFVDVLRGVDLDLHRGEFVSVMGPTGAGKTTLALALNGIVPRSTGGRYRGEVLVHGASTKEHEVAELAPSVGVVFQDPETQLFCMSVEDEVAFGMENLGVPAPQMRTRLAEALALVGMSEYRTRSPRQLSGGQKQRVAIAAVLAMRPSVIVLDEPTSGLDPIGKHEVFSVVEQLRREHSIAVVMIEHECDQIAQFSDRVLLLEAGRVITEGPPADVFYDQEAVARAGVCIPQVAEVATELNALTGSAHRFLTVADAFVGLHDQEVA